MENGSALLLIFHPVKLHSLRFTRKEIEKEDQSSGEIKAAPDVSFLPAQPAPKTSAGTPTRSKGCSCPSQEERRPPFPRPSGYRYDQGERAEPQTVG